MSLLVLNPSLHHLSPPHLVECRCYKAMSLYPKRTSLLYGLLYSLLIINRNKVMKSNSILGCYFYLPLFLGMVIYNNFD